MKKRKEHPLKLMVGERMWGGKPFSEVVKGPADLWQCYTVLAPDGGEDEQLNQIDERKPPTLAGGQLNYGLETL